MDGIQHGSVTSVEGNKGGAARSVCKDRLVCSCTRWSGFEVRSGDRGGRERHIGVIRRVGVVEKRECLVLDIGRARRRFKWWTVVVELTMRSTLEALERVAMKHNQTNLLASLSPEIRY